MQSTCVYPLCAPAPAHVMPHRFHQWQGTVCRTRPPVTDDRRHACVKEIAATMRDGTPRHRLGARPRQPARTPVPVRPADAALAQVRSSADSRGPCGQYGRVLGQGVDGYLGR